MNKCGYCYITNNKEKYLLNKKGDNKEATNTNEEILHNGIFIAYIYIYI